MTHTTAPESQPKPVATATEAAPSPLAQLFIAAKGINETTHVPPMRTSVSREAAAEELLRRKQASSTSK